MSQVLTSSKLIASIKRRAMIPQNQSTFTDDDFLAFANEELALGLIPSILRVHEDYLMYIKEVDLQSGLSEYEIPSRAVGNKLRDVSFKDANNNIYEMTRIGIQDEYEYISTYNFIKAFYVLNNKIILQPKITGTIVGKLRMSYYLRPNDLVTEDKVATVTNINTSTGEVTVNQIPSGYNTAIVYDFIGADSPFVVKNLDVSATSVNTTTKVIQFAVGDVPSDLKVGDYINKSGETIVPQVPSDLHVVLAHRVAARCLEAIGDTEGLQAANAKLAEMEQNTQNLIDNRVEEAPQKIVNRHSPLRNGLFRWHWRWR